LSKQAALLRSASFNGLLSFRSARMGDEGLKAVAGWVKTGLRDNERSSVKTFDITDNALSISALDPLLTILSVLPCLTMLRVSFNPRLSQDMLRNDGVLQRVSDALMHHKSIISVYFDVHPLEVDDRIVALKSKLRRRDEVSVDAGHDDTIGKDERVTSEPQHSVGKTSVAANESISHSGAISALAQAIATLLVDEAKEREKAISIERQQWRSITSLAASRLPQTLRRRNTMVELRPPTRPRASDASVSKRSLAQHTALAALETEMREMSEKKEADARAALIAKMKQKGF